MRRASRTAVVPERGTTVETIYGVLCTNGDKVYVLRSATVGYPVLAEPRLSSDHRLAADDDNLNGKQTAFLLADDGRTPNI